MIQTIVFDFGNVVGFFDNRLVTKRLEPYARLSAEEMHRFIVGGAIEDEYEKGLISSAQFLGRIREHCGLTCSDEFVAQSYADMFWPNADLCGLIPALKSRYRLILGSNTTELHSRHFREQFRDVLVHFDALVLSHEIGVRKPSAAFFDHCRKLAGCSAAECLFIDDLPANVRGAVALGWQAIVYRDFESLRRDLESLGVPLLGTESTSWS